MRAPFRGKACMVCDGEIMSERWRGPKSHGRELEGGKWLEDSPAGRLLDAKRQKWIAEIESIELEEPQYHLSPHGEREELDKVAEADFRKRRAKKPMIREEHRPSVDAILDLWRRHGR
jgi:hypothetical protein